MLVVVVVRLHVAAAVLSFPAVLTSVPPVLHSIVAAAMEATGNFCPPLADFVNKTLDLKALLGGDWVVV